MPRRRATPRIPPVLNGPPRHEDSITTAAPHTFDEFMVYEVALPR
ncbi:MAG: hypothetical protein AAGF11_20905 [Myxococcota bacterium]